MTAEKCPVCEGRGKVPAGFYTPGRRDEETCRGCGGRGVIVSEAVAPAGTPDEALDLTYRP